MKVPVEKTWRLPVVDGVRVSGPEPVAPPSEGITWDVGFSGTISPGPYTDGTVVTITRDSGTFGAKDAQTPFYFSDVEDIPLDVTLPEPWVAAGPLVYATDGRAYSGSRSIRVQMDTDSHSSSYMPIPEGTTEFYFSVRHWWERYVVDPAHNIKCFVLSSGLGSHGTSPSVFSTFGPGEVGSYTGANDLALDPSGFGYEIERVPTGQWHRRENFMRLSTPSVADGVVYLKVNQQGDFRRSWWPAGGHIASRNNTVPHTTYWGELWPTRHTSVGSNTLRSQFLVFYKQSGDRCDHWCDEIYMDRGTNAQARLELGPAAFGTDSRPRNPCPYEAWSTTSITFRLNAGPNGIAGRSLYFINGEGAVERLLGFNA